MTVSTKILTTRSSTFITATRLLSILKWRTQQTIFKTNHRPKQNV